MRKGPLGDGALALLLGAGLFAGAAAPLALVRQPPFQDYAEHVAAAAMALNPGGYPDYACNGLLKTNAAFVAFASLAGRVVGVERAGFGFALLVLAVNALVLPRFVLHFGGRGRMRVAALFALPFVHNWFVSMGMLDFSLGVSLSLLGLVALDQHRRAGSIATGLVAAAWLLGTWYAHPVPVIVVGLLVLVQIASRPGVRAVLAEARAVLPPLAPAACAVVASAAIHLRGTAAPEGAGEATVFQTPLWLLYDLWAHFPAGYTPLSAASLVLAGVLAVLSIGRWRAPIPYFGAAAMGVLALAYALGPYQTVGLGYAGSRLLPYLWMGALLRVPERVDDAARSLLGLLAASYAIGMGVDTVRLAREEDELAAGTSVVTPGARLDVFIFSPRVTSRNTWSLSTAWGDYVTRSGARTWEMPGDTPSLPFRWSHDPPPRLETSAHHRFMDAARTERGFCAAREAAGMGSRDCARLWRDEWAAYYRDVDPFVDAVVMWDPPRDSLDRVPASFAPVMQRGRLWVFGRAASRKQAHLDVDPAGGVGPAR